MSDETIDVIVRDGITVSKGPTPVKHGMIRDCDVYIPVKLDDKPKGPIVPHVDTYASLPGYFLG